MVKKHHPDDRLQRRLIRLAKKKSKVNGKEIQTKEEAERSSRIWKKLNKEFLEEQETYNDLRTIL